jgi:uncharacterized protein YbjT (DUF2867 family)
MSQTAVIAGATGYLGGYVARTAHDAGYRVRALARDAARFDARDGDEVFVGQATDPDTLGGLFEGAEVAFSSIGIRHFRRRPDIWDVDMQANLNLVDAAERAGVRRFVFISVLGGPQLRGRLPVAEARERVVDRLRESTMEWAVLRPTGFFNDLDAYLDMARSGRVWLIGRGSERINPIHGADLAAEAVACFDAPGCPIERDVGGPDVFTQREIGELAFAAVGKPPRFGHVPPGLLDGMAALSAPFNVNLSTFLRMFAQMGRADVVAPPVGTHHLAAHYQASA